MSVARRAVRVTRWIGWTVALSVYWILTRVLIYAGLTLTALYFVLNAGPFPDRLSDALRAVLPGTLRFERLQIAPIPWRVDLLGVRISTPEGEEVVTAGSIEVTMDLVPLVRFLLDPSTRLIEVSFRSIRLRDFTNEIRFDETGELRFLRAFVWPPEPSEPSTAAGAGPDVRLRFSHIIAERGRFRLVFPEWDLSLEGLSVDTSLMVREDGHVLIHTPVVTFERGVGRIHAAPGVSEIPREVPLRAGRVEGFEFDTDHFSIARAQIAMEGLDVDASGSLAFPSGGLLAYDARAVLEIPEDSPPARQATHGLVRGPMRVTVEGRGDEHDPRFSLKLESQDLRVGPMPFGAVALAIEGSRVGAGTAPYSFHDLACDAATPFGPIHVSNGAFRPFAPDPDDPKIEASADIEAGPLDFGSLWQTLRLADWPSPLPVPAKVRLTAHATWTYDPRGPAAHRADVSLRARAGVGTHSILDGAEVSSSLQARWFVSRDPSGHRSMLEVREFSLRSSGLDRVRLRGRVDLTDRTLRLFAEVQKDLASLARGLGGSGRGLLIASDLRIRGPWNAPALESDLLAEDLEVSGWTAKTLRAQVSLDPGGTFTARNLAVDAQYAQVAVQAVHLALPTGHLRMDGASITRINLMWLPLLRPFGIRGSGEAAVGRLELRASDPLRTLSGSGTLSFPMLLAFGKRLKSVSGAWEALNGRFTVSHLSARLDGTAEVQGSGTLDLARSEVAASLSATGVPIATLAGTGTDGPLKGIVFATASLSGPLSDPGLEAQVLVRDLGYADASFGEIAVAARREPGHDLRLSSDRFLPKMRLDPTSGLRFENGRFSALQVGMDIEDLTVQDLWPSVRARTVSARLTGRFDLRMGLLAGGTLEASLTSPPDGVEVALLDGDWTLRNRERLAIEVHETGEVTLSGLALDDGHGLLRACGQVVDRDGQSHLLVRGPVSLAFLRFFKGVFSAASGSVVLDGPVPAALPSGCASYEAAREGAFEVSGPFLSPVLQGVVQTGALELSLRRFPEAVRVDPGTRIQVVGAEEGRFQVRIPADSPLRARLGEGRLALDADIAFRGYLPDSGVLHAVGSDLRFASPGSYFVVVRPDVTAAFSGLAGPDPESARLALRGRIEVTDGSYHRNFDVVRRAFSGVTGARVAEREGTSVFEIAPWLAAASLDLLVTGSRFGVRTRLPFGATDLDVAMDLSVRGTLARPEVWNRVEVLPGGKVVYTVVRREFDVMRGTVDFDGEPSRPILDVVARTRVETPSAQSTTLGGGSRFEPETSSDTSFGEGILVTLAVSGRFPDLDISLTSNARDLDQADLQMLLLTGTTPREAAEGRSGVFDLGLVTEDMTNLVTNLFLSPFVDAIRFGVSPSGGVNAQVEAHLGSRLRFETEVLQQQQGSRYRAGFQVRLTDRLFLEGRMRAVEQSTDPSEIGRRYEAKLRYRIPLD